MASPKKANCTPEQWAAFTEKRNAYRERTKEARRVWWREHYAKKAEEYKQKTRDWLNANKDNVGYIERRRASARLRNTGMDNDTFYALLELQDGKCAICKTTFVSTPHADHCHDLKKPRGLLCPTCNKIEGMIKKSGISPEAYGRLLQAYLDQPPANILDLI